MVPLRLLVLSYIFLRWHSRCMSREPDRQTIAEAIEFWAIGLFVIGSNVWGLIAGGRDPRTGQSASKKSSVVSSEGTILSVTLKAS